MDSYNTSFPSDDALRDWLTGHDEGPVAAWAGEDPARHTWLATVRESYNGSRMPPPPVDTPTAFRRVQETLHASSRPVATTRPRRWIPQLLGGALALAGVATLWFVRSGEAPVTASYATQRMERTTVTLPDGSQVTLAPQTRLQYTQNADGTRVVDLDGQAFFTVAAKIERPLLVKSASLDVRVLGTAFQVRQYAGEPDGSVAVVSGKVAIHMAGHPSRRVILTARQRGVLVDTIVKRDSITDPGVVSGWMNGQLVFRDTPLADVLKTIGRWSPYEFRIADSVLARRAVTVTLAADRPAETIAILQELLDVAIQRDGNRITLHARRAAHRGDRRVPAVQTTVGDNRASFNQQEMGK